MRRRVTIAALALLPAACSGTSSYSTTFNAADHDYAHDAVMHLQADIVLLEASPLAENPGSGERRSGQLRLMRGELAALRGLMRSTGSATPTAAESRAHVADHPDPGLRSGMSSDELIVVTNRAAIERAVSYVPRGRQPSVVDTARRTIDDRTAVAAETVP